MRGFLPMADSTTPRKITRGAQYATLIAALLGWTFDGFEMGLFPLIGNSALKELLAPPPAENADADVAKTPEQLAQEKEDFDNLVNQWFGVIMAVFLVGAASGGVLFGWLGDKIGRVRAMSLSIFTYAIFTGLCGIATEAWHIAVLRFIASLGMGGEWSLGVALVNEIWPGKSRAFIAGLIGAASNVGFLLVPLLSIGLLQDIEGVEATLGGMGLSESAANYLSRNDAWRFLMISGALPALLIFFIRLFVPESHKWEAEHASGKTAHWNNSDLGGMLVGCLAAVAIIFVWSPIAKELPLAMKVAFTLVGLLVSLMGFLHPVKQFLSRTIAAGALPESARSVILRRMLLGACLAGIALLGTWGSLQWAPKWAGSLKPDADGVKHFAREYTQIASALGAIVGTIAAALAAGAFGRRPTYAVLCVASFAAAIYFFQFHDEFGTEFLIACFIAGGVTASFYGFFPLYFPELFPTAVRATGQGLSYNFGRIIAAIGGLQTANLMGYFDNSFPRAGTVLAGIYLIGVFIIWLGPETKGRELPE
jgi:MFS family permease